MRNRRIGPQRPSARMELMKRTFLAALAATSLLTGAALAQSTAVTTTRSFTLAPEQRTVIRQYVVEQRVQPVEVEETLAVGTVLPDDVELLAVPAEWGQTVTRYRYVYAGDRVVLVEPSSRRVVYVVD